MSSSIQRIEYHLALKNNISNQYCTEKPFLTFELFTANVLEPRTPLSGKQIPLTASVQIHFYLFIYF